MKLAKHNQTVFLVLFSLVVFSLAGCKSKKVITSNAALEEKTHNAVIEDVLDTQLKYRTISTKGTVEFKSGSSGQKFPAVFKIIKDSLLQVSIRIPIIGGEAMRVNITPDSVVIIDRLNHNYVAESFKNSRIQSDFDFNFYNLQALLTNQLFVPGKQEVSDKDYNTFKISSTSDLYMLQTKDKGGLLYSFAVDPSNRIASTLVYSEQKNITLQFSYSDFIDDNKSIYPTNMAAKVDIAKKRLDLGISFSKLEIDKNLDIDSSIPTKYKLVSFLELVGSYIKMK